MFIVMEIQVNAEGQVATLVSTYGTLAQAMNKYYTILAFAVVSTVPKHSAVILDQMGVLLERNGFDHPVEPEPEESEE